MIPMADLPSPCPLTTVNEMPVAAFCAFFEGVFEKTPWIVAQAAALRPFASKASLLAAMASILAAADDARKLALLQAHPVLGGQPARRGEVTSASREEQAGLGLDRMQGAEDQAFADLNRAYQERFGFPFIIAVKGQKDRAAILAALRRRIDSPAAVEREAALAEVVKIAGFRLDALVTDAVPA